MLEFDEHRFREQVNKALKSVKTVLDNTRCPQYAADVPHVYGMGRDPLVHNQVVNF
jgi:hypothetical protein